MAVALVQTAPAANAAFGTSIAVTWSSATTTGNLIVVFVGSYSTGEALSVTDTQSNTYSSAITHGVSFSVGLFYAQNITGGSGSVTAHFSPSSGGVIFCHAREYSGLATSSVFDVGHAANGSGTALNSGATATTSNAVELVVAAGALSTNGTMTAGTGFGNMDYFLAGASSTGMADLTTSSTGAQTGLLTNSFSGTWEALVATFKTPGGGTTANNLTLLGVGQ